MIRACAIDLLVRVAAELFPPDVEKKSSIFEKVQILRNRGFAPQALSLELLLYRLRRMLGIQSGLQSETREEDRKIDLPGRNRAY